jgi:maleate cis-trans isomerase
MNRVAEAELPKLAPEGISCHFTRLPYTEISPKGISDMLNALEGSAKLLAGTPYSVGVDVIGLVHATASSMTPTASTEIVGRIRQASNVPATTTLNAVVEALRHLKVKTVSAALPYNKPERSQQLKSFLEGNGLKVDSVFGGDYTAVKDGHEVSGQPPSSAYRLIKEANSENSDAIVMTIPNFRTIEVISELESDLGKIVVTGNQALMWHALQLIGIHKGVSGFGKLLEN